jgi:hypothetical protein
VQQKPDIDFLLILFQGFRLITYKIKDLNGEEIKGTFYEQEMQKSTQDTFRIQRVLKTKGNKFLVKRMGYSDDFNLWIDRNDAMSTGDIKHSPQK